MIFSENRIPLFRIMLLMLKDISKAREKIGFDVLFRHYKCAASPACFRYNAHSE
jgi:hypothetical protein